LLTFCRRVKISHDPNNHSWAYAAESYGQKLLSAQGWRPGQGLGARNAKHFNSPAMPKIKISRKDDTLGLGATLKSQDPIHIRTGFDAFQGLLGRLNGNSDIEVRENEQRIQNRNLALSAQGKWGGVTFVSGGMLVQGDRYKKTGEVQLKSENLERTTKEGGKLGLAEEALVKAKKQRRRTERKKRKEQEKIPEEASAGPISPRQGGSNVLSKNSGCIEVVASAENKDSKCERLSDRAVGKAPGLLSSEARVEHLKTSSTYLLPEGGVAVVKTPVPLLRNGRHIIRGRNIRAKKMAFADTKMLDQVTFRHGLHIICADKGSDFHAKKLSIAFPRSTVVPTTRHVESSSQTAAAEEQLTYQALL